MFVLGRWYRLFTRLSTRPLGTHQSRAFSILEVDMGEERPEFSIVPHVDVDDYDASGSLPRLYLAKSGSAPPYNKLSLAESGTTENLHAAPTLKYLQLERFKMKSTWELVSLQKWAIGRGIAFQLQIKKQSALGSTTISPDAFHLVNLPR